MAKRRSRNRKLSNITIPLPKKLTRDQPISVKDLEATLSHLEQITTQLRKILKVAKQQRQTDTALALFKLPKGKEMVPPVIIGLC